MSNKKRALQKALFLLVEVIVCGIKAIRDQKRLSLQFLTG